jgi:hypothetical protein
MFGKIEAERVRLQRVYPFVANAYKPIFMGRFEEAEGRATLIGEFTLRPDVARFLRWGMAFCVLWSVGASVSIALRGWGQLPWWFPLAGLGMAFVFSSFARLGWRMSEGDIDWLSARVREAIGCPGS